MLSKIKNIVLILSLLSFSNVVFAQFKIGVGSKTQPKENAFDYGNPQKYTIKDITVTGSKFLDANTLVSVSGLAVGEVVNIPGEKISAAIKRLMDQGILEEVEINALKTEGTDIWLEIKLIERPRLNKISLKGIKKSEIETVEEKISANKGKVITEALMKNMRLTVKKHYEQKGYFNTSVKSEQVVDSLRANNATLVFTIDKKSKSKINTITVNGIEEVPDWKAKAKLKKTKEKAPLRIFTPSKYIPKQYKEDKAALVAWMQKNGYRNAQIESDSVIFREDGNIDLIVNVSEDRKFYYRNITFSGNYLHSTDTLNTILGIEKGDVYNPQELDKKINQIPARDLSSFYMDDGYLYFSCTPVEVAVVGDSIDVELRIYEGKQAIVNRIILNGNTKTSDHVVLREILTKPGQKFSKTDLIETQQMLSKLGYFDPETITPVPKPNADGTVDIEYNVEEKSNDNIELSGGWGGIQGFVGTFGVVFNNFAIKDIGDFKKYKPLPKGDGQKLALRFQANGAFQSYSMSFTEPWMGGKKPNSFSVSIFRSVQDLGKYYERLAAYSSNNPFSGSLGFGGTTAGFGGYFKNTGASITFGKRLNWPDRFFNLSSTLSYQHYDVKDSYYLPAFTTGKAHDISLSANVSRYTLNNPIFASMGSSISLSATFNPPYSLFGVDQTNRLDTEPLFIEGQKWMFDADWYTPVVGKLILRLKANMGFMGRYSKDADYSPFGRFVLGGAGMGLQNNNNIGSELIGLRGYDEGVVKEESYESQADVFDTSSTNQFSSNVGGIIYSKYTAELRYPISTNPQATIYVLGFAEAGNAWDSYRDYNPFKLRRSAGVGARVMMAAFGLLGLDYGYAFDPIPGITNQGVKQFTFSIGQQIR